MRYLLLIFLDPTHFWDSRWGREPVDAKDLENRERNIYSGSPFEGFQDATPRSVAPTNQNNQNQSNMDNQEGSFGLQNYQRRYLNQENRRR